MSLKNAVVVLWVVLAAGFVVAPGSTFSGVARTVFWVMLVAHIVEFVSFRQVFVNAPGSMSGHAVQTLIFGLFHIREVREAGGEKPS